MYNCSCWNLSVAFFVARVSLIINISRFFCKRSWRPTWKSRLLIRWQNIFFKYTINSHYMWDVLVTGFWWPLVHFVIFKPEQPVIQPAVAILWHSVVFSGLYLFILPFFVSGYVVIEHAVTNITKGKKCKSCWSVSNRLDARCICSKAFAH